MKINLISAFMRGDEIFTAAVVTPSTALIYNKLVALNNRLGWNNLVIKTSIKGLSDATHLRTNVTRKSLQELIQLDMIMVVNGVDFVSNFTSTLHPLYIVLLPKERDKATLRLLLNESITHSMTDRQTDSHADRQVKQAVSQSAQNKQSAGSDGSAEDGEEKRIGGVDTNDPAVIERRIQIYDNYKALKGEELVNQALRMLADQGIFFPTTEIFVQKLEFVEKVSKNQRIISVM